MRENIDAGFASAFFFAAVTFSLNASGPSVLFSALAGFIVGLAAGSLLHVVSGIFLSLVLWVVFATALGSLNPTYSISGMVVAVALLLMWLTVSIVLRLFMPKSKNQSVSFLFSGVAILLISLIRNSRGWNSVNAFDALARSGEDNAAWLIALSRSVVAGETQLSVASGTSGGPGTGVLISVIREAMNFVGQTPLIASADNGLVLMRSYVILATVVMFIWALIASVALAKLELLTRTLFGLVAALVSYIFIMGLAAVGHFSAAVAVLFLSLSVYFHVVFESDSPKLLWLSRGLVFLSLISAGQSWFPLTGIAFLYLVFVLVSESKKYFIIRPTPRQLKALSLVVVCISLFGYFSYTRFFASFLQNVISIDFITRNLTIPGGYSTANPWLVVIGFVVVVWWGTSPRQNDDAIGRASLVLALVLPIVMLFTWAYFLSPFTPQYGAWKYLYIGAAVACPLAVIATGKMIGNNASQFVLRSVPVLLVLALALFTPPFDKIQWASSKGSIGTAYSAVIVQELQRDPNRPVGCLSTAKDDAANDYIGYLCSRMAFGLGGFDDVKHRVWTAANICTISPEQARNDLPSEFQRNFTVVLFDGTRTSSFAGCQAPSNGAPNGWLSSINWEVIRKVDTSGKVVNIPATQFER